MRFCRFTLALGLMLCCLFDGKSLAQEQPLTDETVMVDCWEIEQIPCQDHPVQICEDVECKKPMKVDLEPQQESSESFIVQDDDRVCPPGTDQVRRDVNGHGNTYPVWRPTYIPEWGHVTFRKTGDVDCTLEVPCGGDCKLKANGKYYCQKDPQAVERKVPKPVAEGVYPCILFEKDQAE